MPTLTVLGTSPAWALPGIPSSGYVLESGGFRLLIDCGHGVAAAWRSHFDVSPDAIIISHAHADHSADLPAFKYATQWGPLGSEKKPLLIATNETLRVLEEIEKVRVGAENFYTETYDFSPLSENDPQSTLQVGPFSVQALLVPHLIPTWALKIKVEGKTLVYSADTGLPIDNFIQFAKGCDLTLIEAALPEAAHGHDDLMRIHLTPTIACIASEQIGAPLTLLTHLHDKSAYSEARKIAKRVWPEGKIELARPGKSYEF